MACTDISSNAGIKLYIAAQTNLPTAVAYVEPTPATAQTAVVAAWAAIPSTAWKEVSQVSGLGARGIKRNSIEYQPIGGPVRRRTLSLDYGAMSVTAADVPEDAGQVLMVQAAANARDYPFRIVHADATATLTVPSVEYFPGIVSGWAIGEAGDADSVKERQGDVLINGYCYVARHASS